jgi:hypothetical protein
MLTHPNESLVAMPLNDAGTVCFFDNIENATDAAESNIVGSTCGYEIFKLGEGYVLKALCPNCGKQGKHFVPPSLGERGVFICKKSALPK